MIEVLSIFFNFVLQEGGIVTFEDNGKSKIFGKGFMVRPLQLLKVFIGRWFEAQSIDY